MSCGLEVIGLRQHPRVPLNGVDRYDVRELNGRNDEAGGFARVERLSGGRERLATLAAALLRPTETVQRRDGGFTVATRQLDCVLCT